MQLSMEGGASEDDERTASRPRPSPLAPSPADGEADDRPLDGIVVAPDAYSRGEVIRHKDFERMTSAELREAERLVDLLKPNLELRKTRRSELHHHGRTLAPRVMFRRNLATGGDLVEWVWKRRVKHPRPLVVLCDISGSMERQSRLLLRFVQALSGSAVHAEAFVFGTHLTRVTRILRDRDRDRGLAKVSEAVNDWAGGTRIGESLRQFNQKWARRVLRSGAVVVVVSDGWDRGDPVAGRPGDGPPPAVVPSADLAQSARGRPGLSAARRRDAGRVPVHRRLPARGHGREPRAPRPDPRGQFAQRSPRGRPSPSTSGRATPPER